LARLKLDHQTESEFQVWQEGPKQLRTVEMLWQKLDYLYRNPQERGYVDDPTHWRYSSARNYAGQPGQVDGVTDWV
jgi:putative transposase